MAEVYVKFVSQKISKIRWRPSEQQGLQQSNIFVTGSWDNDVSHPLISSSNLLLKAIYGLSKFSLNSQGGRILQPYRRQIHETLKLI